MCNALSETPRNELEANEESGSAESLQEMFLFLGFLKRDDTMTQHHRLFDAHVVKSDKN